MLEIEYVAQTILKLLSPGMKPNELMKAARKEHPEVSKKGITRAAFYAMILTAERDPERATSLQDAALKLRAGEERADEARMPKQKKKSAKVFR